jgi:hypothetical protein
MNFKIFGASSRRFEMLNMADFVHRAKFGSSWEILENRYGVQNYVIIFPMQTTSKGRNHIPDTFTLQLVFEGKRK